MNGTPLPWRVTNRGSGNDWDIEGPTGEEMSGMSRGMLYDEADAEFIVSVCNSREELVETLAALVAGIDEWNRSVREIIGHIPDYRWNDLERARAAIAKAREDA